MLKYFSSFMNKAVLVAFISAFVFSCSDSESHLGPPKIISYSVESEFPGASVVINGKNFGKSASDVTVTFYSEQEAEITAITNSSITVTIPDDAYVGNLTVKVKDQEVEGPVFNVLTWCLSGSGEGVFPCNRMAPIEAGK
jgi:hypothetical protein